MSLTVPRFTIKNKFDYSNTAPEKQLNESSWRYLYENTENNPNSPESYDDPFYKEQLPWLTLYKTHKDLLQIKLVTTVAYVEKVTDPVNNPNVTHFEAVYIKGFPLMLQGPDSQFDDKNNISDDCWERNWPFYYEHVENLSTDLSNNVSNWDNFNTGNSKVIVDMKKTERRNLIILDLDNNDFVLKNTGIGQNKFIDPNVENYNSKERPSYLVVRLDSAIEESSFVYTGGNTPEAGLVIDNSKFNDGTQNYPVDTGSTPKLYVFNYVYSGYVISPYDFMSAFTTDFLRGRFTISNTLFSGYINRDLNKNLSPNVIQVNSKFFSSTHQLKDGWDNSRKNAHKLIKTPYYYNFFLQGPELNIEDISGTIINNGSTSSDRFKTILYSSTNLYPDANGNQYGIEKLFWCSLTSPRHTIYSGFKNNGRQKAFIGNYLNVNEVDASYNSIDGRIFINPNADYMPEKKNVVTGGSTTSATMTPGVNNDDFNFDATDTSNHGSGTVSDPWTGHSVIDGQNYQEANIYFTANGNGTAYIKMHVSSESSFDFGYLYVNGSQQTQLSGPNQWYPSSTSYQGFTLQENGQVRFRYTKDGSVHDYNDELVFYIYWEGQTTTIPTSSTSQFLASGYIEREIREESVKYNNLSNPPTYTGKNEINMVRKTLTPYYHPPQFNDEDAVKKYAFLYPENETWDNYASGGTLIDIGTSNIDIDNCQIIELRNLIDFTENTVINIDISLNNTSDQFQNLGKKTITFLTSGDTIYGDATSNPTWKNGIQLSNNSVKSKYSSADSRTLDRIDKDEYRILFSHEDKPNTKKHIYVMDIATGSYKVNESDINIFSSKDNNNGADIDTFISNLNWNSHKELVSFIANVYQIKLNQSNNSGTVFRENGEFLNFSLDGLDQQVSIYNEPHFYINDNDAEIRNPIFAYFNFYGITSSEFIGGVDWHKGGGLNGGGENQLDINFVLRKCLTGVNNGNRKRLTDSPYLLLIDNFRFTNQYSDLSKLYFNSNIFYGATNFAFSNIYAKTGLNDIYNQTDVLFLDKTSGPSNPEWRDNSYKTNGLDVTTLSNNSTVTNVTNIKFLISGTGVELYSGSVFGKFNINDRVLSSTSNVNEPACVELSNGADISFNGVNTKYECFNFYKTAYVASQKNLFISDYWKWKERLVSLTIPVPEYLGRIPQGYNIVDRNINNRYNIYDWESNDVPHNLYAGTKVHNPQSAYENQSLINFSVEVSTISFNVTHMLVNTWSGNIDINNNINSNAVVGLSSFANASGNHFTIKGSPKIFIAGGLSITPTIEDSPVYLNFDVNGQLNFATDQDPGNTTTEELSKAPSDVPEADGNIIDFPINLFSIPYSDAGQPLWSYTGGWFSRQLSTPGSGADNLDTFRKGIFIPMVEEVDIDGGSTILVTPSERYYSTFEFNKFSLMQAPTNITISDDLPYDGGIRKEEQAFPIELLFCYPFNIPEDKKPDKIVTTYNNSDGATTSTEFDNYKGNKRFSKIYALNVTGDNIVENNINFRDRSIFPETLIVNCVELPPPVQVNNFNDMLASNNSFVKLVWKGYNFDYSSGNPRSQLGNVGNIIWKIERFQTQLEIKTKIFEGVITPDGGNNANGFNLSTYTYIDKNIRIYDKYIYTVSGTYEYNFIRNTIDTTIYTLQMPFGSFKTQELIVCKNNKFEYGRYNTTSTNLKLYRPLLLTRPEGQRDEYGRKSGGSCLGNIFTRSTGISSSQNIYASTTNQITKKGTYVLLSKQRFRPFR